MLYEVITSSIVWWNAVSKHPTWIAFGIASIKASTPVILAGLWSGANGINSLISFITSLSITTDEEYLRNNFV